MQLLLHTKEQIKHMSRCKWTHAAAVIVVKIKQTKILRRKFLWMEEKQCYDDYAHANSLWWWAVWLQIHIWKIWITTVQHQKKEEAKISHRSLLNNFFYESNNFYGEHSTYHISHLISRYVWRLTCLMQSLYNYWHLRKCSVESAHKMRANYEQKLEWWIEMMSIFKGCGHEFSIIPNFFKI